MKPCESYASKRRVSMLVLAAAVVGIAGVDDGLVLGSGEGRSSSDGSCHYLLLSDVDPAMASILQTPGITVWRQTESHVLATASDAALGVLHARGVRYEIMTKQRFESHFTGVTATAAGEPALAPLRQHRNVAVMVDDAVYPLLQTRLERYSQDVQASLDVTLTIHHRTWADAVELRHDLVDLHDSEGVEGAILVGLLPYAMWEFSWGERCPIPFFFEDLDGAFLDTDLDGDLDLHHWGLNEGPEIWVSLMRPPANDVSALAAFLDKTHAYYSGELTNRPRGFVCINNDWWDSIPSVQDSLIPLYGNGIDVVGGETWEVNGDEYTGPLADGYEITSLWVHSSSSLHYFDSDPDVSSIDVRDLAPGSFLTVVWGCHAFDFDESPESNFGAAYTFGESYGLAAVGATRSIGTENQERLFEVLESVDLSAAYFAFLEFNYNVNYIQERFPTEDILRFVWDFALFGDPFILDPQRATWVDFSFTGTEFGSFVAPFDTLGEGIAAARTGGFVNFKAGTSGETLTITKPVTLRSYFGNTVVGHP